MRDENKLRSEPCLKIVIADDHKMVVETVSDFLGKSGEFNIVPAHSLDEVMSTLKGAADIDIVLLDLKMPGMAGIASIQSVVDFNPDLKVVIFSGYTDSIFIERALKIGVKGYIPKSLPARALPSVLRLIDSGQVFLPFQIAELSAHGENKANLTELEISIVRMIADGATNKLIANEVGQTEANVKMFMRSICKKLGAKNRAHAAILGRDLLHDMD